jgi:Holliday junction resolvase-like predicted endonuclease
MERYRRSLYSRKSGMLAALLLGSLGLGGCGLFGKSDEQPVEQVKTKEEPGKSQMTVGELDQMAKNFSDRIVARVSTACDHIKLEAPDEGLRAKAHHLKLSIALAAYDIVTGSGGSPQVPGAAQHVLDLAVLAELQYLRWVEEKAARDEFGDRGGDRLAEACQKSREDIWQIAARVIKPDQIDRIKTLAAQWRAKNLNVEWLARVRFDIIAQGQEGAGILESVGAAFNPINSVTKSVDDVRIVAQQALFYAKRAPLLIDWTTEATVTDTLAIPKVSGIVQKVTETLGSVARLAAQLEHLVEPSSQEPAINSTIQEVQESLVQAKELVREVHSLEEAVRPFLEKPKDAAPKKATDYEAVATKVSDAAHTTTSLVRETRMLAESPSAVRNVDDMLARVSRDIAHSGRDVVDHATWRAIQLVLVIAVLVALFKGVRYWRRRRKPAPAP